MRKVLYTASTYSHIRNFHRPYLDWFRREGWEVHVAAGGEASGVPEADDCLSLPFAKHMTAPSNFRCAKLLGRRMEEEGYDLVVTHTALAAFFTRLPLLRRRERPRVVNMVHGYLFDEGTPFVKRNILLNAERLTAPCTDLLLTMNRSDQETARRYRLGGRLANIPGVGVAYGRIDNTPSEEGKNLRRTWEIPSDVFLLVYPAEFSKRKNQALLLRGLAALPKQVWLLLPGEGACLEECRALARELGVADRVRFPGQVSNIPAWLRAADCAVSASHSEGLPFNVMEAMRAGLPIVATDVKGHRDLLEGGAGLLYPDGDGAAFVTAVNRLLADGAERERLGRTAYAASGRYALETVLPQVTAVLRNAMPELFLPDLLPAR